MKVERRALLPHFYVSVLGVLVVSASMCASASALPAKPSSVSQNGQAVSVHRSPLFPNPFNFASDVVLVRFVMRNDPVLSTMVAGCTDLSVKRHELNGTKYFNLSGSCYEKNTPPEDLDCGFYDIKAVGTIDNPIQATVRKITLTLVCGSEGHPRQH